MDRPRAWIAALGCQTPASTSQPPRRTPAGSHPVTSTRRASGRASCRNRRAAAWTSTRLGRCGWKSFAGHSCSRRAGSARPACLCTMAARQLRVFSTTLLSIFQGEAAAGRRRRLSGRPAVPRSGSASRSLLDFRVELGDLAVHLAPIRFRAASRTFSAQRLLQFQAGGAEELPLRIVRVAGQRCRG